MVTALEAAPGSARLLNPHERVRYRETYGTIPDLIDAARAETADGNLGNAWALYEQALAAELRRRWVEHCGKVNTPWRDVGTLRQKLRSCGILDVWTFQAIDILRARPKSIGWRHLDTVAALVTGLCLEQSRGGVACRA